MCCYVHTTKEHSAVCVQLNRALNHDLDKFDPFTVMHVVNIAPWGCTECGLHMCSGHAPGRLLLRQEPELLFLDWCLLAFTNIFVRCRIRLSRFPSNYLCAH